MPLAVNILLGCIVFVIDAFIIPALFSCRKPIEDRPELWERN